MKKILVLLIAAALIFSLTACTGEEPTEKTGSVYWFNFKPEADAALQNVAKSYKNQTGVDVKVVTAASGGYNTALIAEMDKKNAPTLFVVGNMESLKTWGDYCYDLRGTSVFDKLNQDIILYNEDGSVASIGYCYECFGIIVNKDLLGKAGYSIEDIYNFETLSAVASDIHKRSGELGFDAFTSSGLDSSSSWRFSGHLANMPLYYEFNDRGVNFQVPSLTGDYLYAFKNIWDLYINNSSVTGASLATATADMATAEFTERKAVFYQNGSWEYHKLKEAGFTDDELQMIPIYTGVPGEENAGLCSGTENCWAVNKNASEEDIKATLDFMDWLVTSDEGTKVMTEEFGAIPYEGAPEDANLFIKNASEYVNGGKYSVSWDFNLTPGVEMWRMGLVDALTKYSAGLSDWSEVEKAFVTGWEQQYKIENQ
ncbi:MAG: extracellular solute-binding protein [Clostridia bacterium]|nr:extracellular solute-binding protein [Clostridia bacterium]